MNASGRIFGMLVWLGGLAVAGAIVLGVTAARVGEQRSSTYGNAYFQFQKSWGGEIGVVPPQFSIIRTYTESVYNNVTKLYEDVEKSETLPIYPRTVKLDSTINYGEQERDLLIFNAFEAVNTETYVVANSTAYTGDLMVKVSNPDNANLVYDYTVVSEDAVIRPVVGKSLLLLEDVSPGEEAEVTVTYSTKGMDVFKYNLSAYQNNVIQSIEAEIKLNTREFELYRFGLPNNIEYADGGATVRFNVNDFSTTQDLGVTFLAKQRYLDQIQSLMTYSPVSLALFLIVIFFFSQIYAVRFNPFHYLFLAMIDVFYFLFVAYLIRFFGIVPTFAIAIVLTAAMFFLYCPNVFGWRFALRIVGVYLFLLTVVFSLIFLAPIFRGLMFVVLVFLIFMSIMIFVSRSDLSKWYIVSDAPAE